MHGSNGGSRKGLSMVMKTRDCVVRDTGLRGQLKSKDVTETWASS